VKRVVIDGDLCQGSGECIAIAGSPALALDDRGVAHLVEPDVLFSDAAAEQMVATCPSMAISIEA
jgi:ferredoxin